MQGPRLLLYYAPNTMRTILVIGDRRQPHGPRVDSHFLAAPAVLLN